EPYMTIAIPIERFAGDMAGVLIAAVNLQYIWEGVLRVKVGRAGYAYVVSGEGGLIAHPDITLVLQKLPVRELGQVKAGRARWSAGRDSRLPNPIWLVRRSSPLMPRFPTWVGRCSSNGQSARPMPHCMLRF